MKNKKTGSVGESIIKKFEDGLDNAYRDFHWMFRVYDCQTKEEVTKDFVMTHDGKFILKSGEDYNMEDYHIEWLGRNGHLVGNGKWEVYLENNEALRELKRIFG